MGSEATDAELMRGTRDGDRDAFGRLVDRHKDALVGYLTRLTGAPDRADDLAQEAFLRLFRGADRYSENGHLKAYLYRIATNLLRSEERQRRRRETLLHLFSAGSNGTHPETARDRLLGSEIQEVVARAVSELPLRFRVPLVLHEIEGWTQPAIADALGCQAGTVKSRLHRARARLKVQLAPYWNGEES